MDRGKDFATVHGERAPGDRHAVVFFYQDQLPYDAEGFLIADHPDLLGDDPKHEKLRQLVEKKMKKAVKVAAKAPATIVTADDEGEPTEDVEEQDDEGVNLEAWARGEQEYVWNEVTQQIARRYSKRVKNKEDALDLLIAEKVVTLNDLPPHFRKLLN